MRRLDVTLAPMWIKSADVLLRELAEHFSLYDVSVNVGRVVDEDLPGVAYSYERATEDEDATVRRVIQQVIGRVPDNLVTDGSAKYVDIDLRVRKLIGPEDRSRLAEVAPSMSLADSVAADFLHYLSGYGLDANDVIAASVLRAVPADDLTEVRDDRG